MNTALQNIDSSRLLTETAAADYLGFSIRALQAWRCNGRGPRFVKISARAIRYRLADLMSWSEERVVTSTSDVLAKARRS